MISASVRAVLEVPVGQIVPDPDQPRSTIRDGDLAELAESLRARGVIQPLLVGPHPDDGARQATPYMLIAGERRLKAAVLARLETVPVVVREEPLTPSERLMLQLDENDGLLRRELSLYERATALLRAFQASGLKQEDFARRHRKAPSWISHYVWLGRLQGLTRDALRDGYLTGLGSIRLFARLDHDEQELLLERARRESQPITPQLIESTAQRADRRRNGAPPQPEPGEPVSMEALAPSIAEETPDEREPTTAAGNGAEPPEKADGGNGRLGRTSTRPARDAREEPLSASPPPAPPPSAAAGFLDAGRIIARSAAARMRAAAAASAVSIVLTPRQLSSLLILLGEDPRGSAADQVEQLLKILV